jgi:RecB family exonuclease
MPAGFLREPLKDRTLAPYLHQRPGIGFQTDIFAQAADVTPIAAWLAMPPVADLSARLSASTLQRYEVCPLQFKLEREWRIPGEVPAAMQYGGAMHRVLRAYFDSVRFERRMSEEHVLDMFRSELKEAKIQDRYQHDLYEQQGIDQLKAFVASCENAPCPDVLHTEEFFEIKVGESTVVGRIDRIDKLPDGRVVITDYKTGKAQSQEDADKSLQLSVYALAAREKWGYQAESLVLYNLGENTSAFTTRADSALQGAKLKIEEVAAKVAEGKFDPKTGFHCRFCAYQTLCPATEKRVYSIAEIKKNKPARN